MEFHDEKSISFLVCVEVFIGMIHVSAINKFKKGVIGAINIKKYTVIGANYDIIGMC